MLYLQEEAVRSYCHGFSYMYMFWYTAEPLKTAKYLGHKCFPAVFKH